MKKYSQSEINSMKEEKVMDLFEKGRIDDDQVQRWYDNQEEMSYLADSFIKYELQYWI